MKAINSAFVKRISVEFLFQSDVVSDGDWNDDAIARLRCGFLIGLHRSKILSNQSQSSDSRLSEVVVGV